MPARSIITSAVHELSVPFVNAGSLRKGSLPPKNFHIFQMISMAMTVVLTAYEKFWAVRAALAELPPVSHHAPV
jgi:hypothetical protein